MDLKLGVTQHRKNRTPNASGRSNENAYVNGFFMSLAFARGRRPKGKEKGVVGTKEARGVREEGGRGTRSPLPCPSRAVSRPNFLPFPFRTPATQAILSSVLHIFFRITLFWQRKFEERNL